MFGGRRLRRFLVKVIHVSFQCGHTVEFEVALVTTKFLLVSILYMLCDIELFTVAVATHWAF